MSTVTSVSGGSIVNAAVAQTCDLPAAESTDEFRRCCPTELLKLNDGGVYNNLGTDWFDELETQSRSTLWSFGYFLDLAGRGGVGAEDVESQSDGDEEDDGDRIG